MRFAQKSGNGTACFRNHRCAEQREFGYEIINLGESQTIELGRLIELLENALDTKAQIDRQPLQPGDVPITYANIDKARRLLEYDPQVKIEDGIPRFVEWFRQPDSASC